MANFYGLVGGARGDASRTGSKYLRTLAASHSGAIKVELFRDGDGEELAVVSFVRWQGQGEERELYRGPVNGKRKPAKPATRRGEKA